MTTTAAVMLFASQATFADGGEADTCTISGAEFVKTTASEKELCDSFTQRLKEALSRFGATDEQDLIVAIDIARQGSIKASVTARASDGTETHSEMGLDVMDRPIAQKDLDELADAVAHSMLQQQRAAAN